MSVLLLKASELLVVRDVELGVIVEAVVDKFIIVVVVKVDE